MVRMGLRIALFGQAPFGRDAAVRVVEAGHELVAVHVPPDAGRKQDPLAAEAQQRGWPLFRHRAYRRAGVALPERIKEYSEHGADLNLMPFTTAILPPEIVDAPRLGSLCFHPSLLPAFRGGNALAWQIILGAEETGVTVFRPDEGVDTGPIVVQKRGVLIQQGDTAASLYFDRLYPLGIEALAEAVEAVASGTAVYTPQSEAGASFQGLVDDVAARLDWSLEGRDLDRRVRGCDPQPGAWAERQGAVLRLYGGSLESTPHGARPGTVLEPTGDGRLRIATAGDGVLCIERVRPEGAPKMAAAEAGIAVGEKLS